MNTQQDTQVHWLRCTDNSPVEKQGFLRLWQVLNLGTDARTI